MNTIQRQDILRKILALCCLVGYLCYMVAFIIPYWVDVPSLGVDRYHYGLFSKCIEQYDSQLCVTLGFETGHHVVSQGFGIMALISYTVTAVVLSMAVCWRQSWVKNLLFIGTIGGSLTAIFGIIVVVFMVKVREQELASLLFGTYLAASGIAISALVSICGFILAWRTLFPKPITTKSENPIFQNYMQNEPCRSPSPTDYDKRRISRGGTAFIGTPGGVSISVVNVDLPTEKIDDDSSSNSSDPPPRKPKSRSGSVPASLLKDRRESKALRELRNIYGGEKRSPKPGTKTPKYSIPF